MAITGIVPAAFTHKLGSILGATAYSIARKERLIAKHQLAAALRINEESPRVELLVKAIFKHMGISAVEICRILLRPNMAPRVIIPDASRQALEKALAAQKGVIFATGHLGNWELMAMTLAAKGYPISAVAKASYDPRFTAFMDKARRRVGVDAIYRGSPGATTKIMRAIKNNRAVGFLIDQDTSVPSEFVTFFGRQASTPIGAGKLSSITGAPVVVGNIYRTRKGYHVIEISYLGKASDAIKSTRQITAMLEQKIKTRPSQWVWFHKRWKTRPDKQHAAADENAA